MQTSEEKHDNIVDLSNHARTWYAIEYDPYGEPRSVPIEIRTAEGNAFYGFNPAQHEVSCAICREPTWWDVQFCFSHDPKTICKGCGMRSGHKAYLCMDCDNKKVPAV